MLRVKPQFIRFFSISLLISTITLTTVIAEENKGGDFVTVGNTNDCDFRTGNSKIQNAIDSGATEVRVAIGTYNENIQINNIDAFIKGGYSSCSAANNGNQDSLPTATIISGSNLDSVIRIFGSLERNTVILSHLRLTNGRNSDVNPGGGISAINADVDLRLNDIFINDNYGSQGGGIAILTGKTNITAHNIMIRDNFASSGGGIFCDGSGLATIIIDGDEASTYGITQNIANNGNGGGVYLSNGCQFTSYVGTDSNTSEDRRGIYLNLATGNGGGLYLASESKAEIIGSQKCFQENSGQICRGYNSEPVNISYNVSDLEQDANGSGAGIYATGANTQVKITNGLIEGNNTSRGNAGAVYVGFGAEFISDSDFSSGPCWNPAACNQILENNASLGGAIKAESGSLVSINRTLFSKHLANAGNIVHADGTNTQIHMEGNLIFENGDFSGDFSNRNLFEITNNANLNLTFCTIADNNLTNSRPVILNQSSSVSIEASIVSEDSGILVYSGSSPVSENFYCLLVHESASLSGAIEYVTTSQNPGFVDRKNDNYHLNVNLSPAIDYCDNQSASMLTDSDNHARGWDWTEISDFQGPYDLGYDENTDIIFMNGFEM